MATNLKGRSLLTLAGRLVRRDPAPRRAGDQPEGPQAGRGAAGQRTRQEHRAHLPRSRRCAPAFRSSWRRPTSARTSRSFRPTTSASAWKESVADIARVFGRMFDAIAFPRLRSTRRSEAMSRWAGIPVWNCLCDDYHPTQVLADFMTVQENFRPPEGHPHRLRGRRAEQHTGEHLGDRRARDGCRPAGSCSPKSLQPDKRRIDGFAMGRTGPPAASPSPTT